MSEEKPKPKKKKPAGLQDGSLNPCYEVLFPYRPPGDVRLYMPGAILNLESLTREQIRKALDNKWIMTADGEPGNKPLSDKPPCKRC